MTEDTVVFDRRVYPCPACGASLSMDFAACPWCDWEPSMRSAP